MSDSRLPQRMAGGYHITAICWQITADERVVQAVTGRFILPMPRGRNIGEHELVQRLRGLRGMAREAAELAAQIEGRSSGRPPIQERVVIHVMSGDTVLGTINGYRRVIGPRGNVIVRGDHA